MNVSSLRFAARACCSALVLGLAVASGAPLPESADVSSWLTRMQQAAEQRSYLGTLAIASGGVVSSSRVSHHVDGRQRYERVEMLDGAQPKERVRHNDIVYTLWPRDRLAVHERLDAVAGFPSLPTSAQRAHESYELRHQGRARVAGREVDVLLLSPRDPLRFAQRLWADRESGLLLRADVLASGGEVLESAAFSDVAIDSPKAARAQVNPRKKLDGYRVVQPPTRHVALDSQGWMLTRPVPGFELISCVQRSLEGTVSANGPMVLQSVFSDGLTHVSVFIEPYDENRHVPVSTSSGAAHVSMARRGQWWLTIVGEVPMQTIAQFEAMLQRKP